MKEVELLAPAGSYEKAKIAFLYGADAVYCGTSSLSLRTRADMQDDDLEKTVKYAHSIGKKVYVTLNIFAWDEKYDEIIEMAKKLEKLKPDGIIAADGGVIEVLKQYAPSVAINVRGRCRSCVRRLPCDRCPSATPRWARRRNRPGCSCGRRS